MEGLTGWHLVILLVVVVLLFGSKRLPEMARAVGQSARILKSEMTSARADDQTHGQQGQPEPSASGEQPPPLTARLDTPPGQPIPVQEPTSGTTHPPTG
ncbi:MAG: Sec-independent protein translocase subunit TatA [Pseudonocardiaceae bacterium]